MRKSRLWRPGATLSGCPLDIQTAVPVSSHSNQHQFLWSMERSNCPGKVQSWWPLSHSLPSDGCAILCKESTAEVLTVGKCQLQKVGTTDPAAHRSEEVTTLPGPILLPTGMVFPRHLPDTPASIQLCSQSFQRNRTKHGSWEPCKNKLNFLQATPPPHGEHLPWSLDTTSLERELWTRRPG